MKQVRITIKGVSPYSASRYHETPKEEGETHEAYDKRTCKEKLHTNGDGLVVIPGVQIKNGLEWICKYLGERVKEKGRATWTKHFTAGTMPLSNLELGVSPDDFDVLPLRCNAQGRKGGSLGVTRYFPTINQWGGSLSFAVLDPSITEELFERYLREVGRFCGLGRWRPANGGMNGRFDVVSLEWS